MSKLEAHPAIQQIEKMWREGHRYAHIRDWLDENDYPSVVRTTLGSYASNHWDDDDPDRVLERDPEITLGQAKAVAKLLNDNGFDPEEVAGSLKQVRLNEWETTVAGEDGPETVTNKGISIVVDAKKLEPDFVIKQATPVDVYYEPPEGVKKAKQNGKWAVVLPDAQRPFDDEAAVDVCLQVIADVQATHGVDTIIHLGDDLDLPDFSKYTTAPEVLDRIQEGIDKQYNTLAVERAICPDADIYWLEGNHETRMVNWLVDNAPMLVGLSRAGEPQPVLDVPYLCRLDELEVEYVGPYPEGEVWVNDHLRFIHGTITKSNKGASAAAYLSQGHLSTIYGHIHRAELVYQTRHTPHGPRTYLAGSPGTLCKLSGQVPSHRSGINSKGQQGGTTTEDWQQGLWLVWYQEDGKQMYAVEQIQIWGGWAMWRGKHYQASREAGEYVPLS